MSGHGWWDYEPDQLWRLPPAHVCPLTRQEADLCAKGFYPATLYIRAPPPEGFPTDDPWIKRHEETPIHREDHYGEDQLDAAKAGGVRE